MNTSFPTSQKLYVIYFHFHWQKHHLIAVLYIVAIDIVGNNFTYVFQWTDMFKAFLQEKKWSLNKETPTLKDYLENGWMSVSGVVILVHTYFFMTQKITKHGLESLENYHNLLRWSSIIFRLCNDLGTSTVLNTLINL